MEMAIRKRDLRKYSLQLHLHPRELFDELYEKCQIFETGVFKELTSEELEKMIKTLSN